MVYDTGGGGFSIAGSISCGVAMAFLAVCFLLALYVALTAIPEGGSSYLVMEPRGLAVANGVIAFGMTQVCLLFLR